MKSNNHCYLKVVSWCMALRKENGTNPEIGSEKMENGDWTLTKKTWSQESDAISDTAEITIYYTSLFLVLYWMENKIFFSVSCATQHINLYFPRYFPYRLSLENVSVHIFHKWKHSRLHIFSPVQLSWKARLGKKSF